MKRTSTLDRPVRWDVLAHGSGVDSGVDELLHAYTELGASAFENSLRKKYADCPEVTITVTPIY